MSEKTGLKRINFCGDCTHFDEEECTEGPHEGEDVCDQTEACDNFLSVCPFMKEIFDTHHGYFVVCTRDLKEGVRATWQTPDCNPTKNCEKFDTNKD